MAILIKAFQTNDGKVFYGEDAEKKAHDHEKIKLLAEKIEIAVEAARRLFKIEPSNYQEHRRKEENLMENLDSDFEFDFLIEQMMRLRAYDPNAFMQLIKHIKRI